MLADGPEAHVSCARLARYVRQPLRVHSWAPPVLQSPVLDQRPVLFGPRVALPPTFWPPVVVRPIRVLPAWAPAAGALGTDLALSKGLKEHGLGTGGMSPCSAAAHGSLLAVL